MTRNRLLLVYHFSLLAVLFGVVLHAPLSVYLGSLWPDYSELIKAWKEIVLFLLAIVAAILLTREKKWLVLLRSRLVQLSIGFIGLHLLLLPLFWQGLAPSIAGLMIDLRFIATFLLFYVLVLLEPTAIRSVLKTALAAGVVVVGFGVLQITALPDDILTHLGYSKTTITPYSTIDKNPDFVRINSTTRGPNPLGALCVLYAGILMAFIVSRWRTLSKRWRWGMTLSLAATLSVLFASFSRSAYIGAALTLLIIATSFLKVGRKRLLVGIGGLAFISLAIGGLLSTTDWYKNVVLHEDPESTVVEKSNEGHIESLSEGASRMARQPLGAGIGSTGSAVVYGSGSGPMIENYYLFVAHEAGWLGFVGFVAIMILVLKELYKRKITWQAQALLASGIGLSIVGLLLPVWTDETVAITWWALAGSIIGGGYETRTRQQKATRTP